MALINGRYSGDRWHVVFGAGAPEPERFALSECCAALSRFLHYTLTCSDSEGLDGREKTHNLLLLGTAETNASIAEYCALSGDAVPAKEESFFIRVGESVFSPGKSLIVLCGADSRGVLYAVCDFIHRYADTLPFYGDYRGGQKQEPFLSKCPEFYLSSAPAIRSRGIWTWGHVIYDYRGFIDNMARWKLNTLVVWNDHAPVNGKEIVSYAHSRGIRLIWGFSWGWGFGRIDFTDPAAVNEWRVRVIDEYEQKYESFGGDGIYFQTDTEFDEKPGEKSVAESVVRWVNGIAAALLERHPGLSIEFGLHATSVRSHLDDIAKLDSRVTVTWENMGAFPFDYRASNVSGFEETKALAERALALRGERERTGFVLKGVITLYWPEFEKQQGSFLLGEEDEAVISRRLEAARPIVRYEQASWLENLPYLREVVSAAAASKACTGSVTLLCEDGCFERCQWAPVALFAETLWSPDKPSNQVLREVGQTRGVVFA